MSLSTLLGDRRETTISGGSTSITLKADGSLFVNGSAARNYPEIVETLHTILKAIGDQHQAAWDAALKKDTP